MRSEALLVQTGQAPLLAPEASTFMSARMRLVATFIHFVNTIWLSTNIRECGLVANRWLGERLPAVSALEGHFVILSLLAIHADMIRIFLTASAEVVRAVGTSDPELGHMFSSLTCHRLSCLILRRVIWCRWIEGEYLVALRTLNNVVSIGHHNLRLLLTNILKPLVSQGLA